MFRNAVVDDAEFILSLRTDPDKAKYLSQTRNNLEQQRNWLENYSINEGQAYFIIENDGEAIGTVRLYDAKGKSFAGGLGSSRTVVRRTQQLSQRLWSTHFPQIA